MDEDDFEDLFDALESDDCLQHGSPDSNPSAAPVSDEFTNIADAEDDIACDLFTHNMWENGRVSIPKSNTAQTNGPESAETVQLNGAIQSVVTPKIEILAKIETIFEEMADVLLNERGQMSILLMRRTRLSSSLNTKQPSPVVQTTVERRIGFPGKTEKEAWQFTVLTRILELMHEALRNDVVLSKRDIYYRDPALFGKQAHVDRFVDDIACTFGVSRSALGVTAVAKGLIVGAVKFCRRDGSSLDAAIDQEGTLVPSLRDVLSVDMAQVKWILVIEKEATFRSIAASALWKTAQSTGVLITAKGYPDISTRALLRFLCTPSLQNGFCSPPVFALVDYDPDGLAIFSTYKHGSVGLAHESANLSLSQLQWLGLRSKQIMSDSENPHVSQGFLTLSDRDRKRAQSMLAWDALALEAEIRQELQTMLMLNTKTELQLLDAIPGGMIQLLEQELPL